jgi:hypothetical protein
MSAKFGPKVPIANGPPPAEMLTPGNVRGGVWYDINSNSRLAIPSLKALHLVVPATSPTVLFHYKFGGNSNQKICQEIPAY